jgi:hypothetical protein
MMHTAGLFCLSLALPLLILFVLWNGLQGLAEAGAYSLLR